MNLFYQRLTQTRPVNKETQLSKYFQRRRKQTLTQLLKFPRNRHLKTSL